MEKRKALAAICISALVVICAFSLIGCNKKTNDGSGSVAATVNGLEIMEDDITYQIEKMRKSNGWDDDNTMAMYLAMYGMTPTSLRDNVLEGMEKDKTVEVVCAEKGITADEATVDEQVANIRSNYKTEAEWKKALENSGYKSEEKYREALRVDIMSKQLEEQVAKETEVTDALVLEYSKLFAEKFKGAKKSSHILFASEDKDKAQEVLDKLNAGTLTFEDAVKEYSTDTASAEKGGDVGWDCETSFVTAYTDGLAKLEKGQMSELVESEYGYHIIKCTDVCTIDGELSSMSQLPDELQTSAKDRVKTMTENASEYDTWLSTVLEGLKVVKNDIPEGVSYNVDMSSYNNITTTDTSTDDVVTEDGNSTSTSTSTSASASSDASASASASASPASSSN